MSGLSERPPEGSQLEPTSHHPPPQASPCQLLLEEEKSSLCFLTGTSNPALQDQISLLVTLFLLTIVVLSHGCHSSHVASFRSVNARPCSDH